MTTNKAFAESEGVLSEPQAAGRECPKCKSPMSYQIWESSDGAYEDEKYTCSNEKCRHVLWIDGIDS